MTAVSDPEIEHSPLSGEHTSEGITVRVEINRLRDGSGGWALEVVDYEGASTVWDEEFATGRAAYDEFMRTVEQDGIRTFLIEPGIPTVH